MKNAVLSHALLIAIFSFSLQAMDAPQQNTPKLSSIEESLVIQEIQNNGVQPILDQINKPDFQTLIIKEKFDRYSNTPLSQSVFGKIDEIEAAPRINRNPRNYLGEGTRYFFKPSNKQDKVEVTARLSNAQEIRQICASFDQ